MKKQIVLLAVTCLMLNTLISAKGFIFSASLSDSPQVQSPIFELTSLLSSPARALNSIVRDSIPLFPEYKTHKTSDKDNSANTSAKYSLPGSTQKTYETAKTVKSCTHGYSTSAVVQRITDSYRTHAPPGSGDFLILLFLMYFVLLRRSNLPWEIAVYRRPLI